MVDWTKPLKATHDDGTEVMVELIRGEQNPDKEGDYAIVDILHDADGPGPAVFTPNGKPWIDEDWANVWTISNR